jgi:WhiB family redox-sensing transcriptional regulator
VTDVIHAGRITSMQGSIQGGLQGSLQGGLQGSLQDAAGPMGAVGEPIDLFDDADELAELAWQERALCAQTDPEAFFPEKGGSTRGAKKVCLGCEVRGECLEYALAHDERFGIWGGLSERERRRLKKEAV